MSKTVDAHLAAPLLLQKKVKNSAKSSHLPDMALLADGTPQLVDLLALFVVF